MPAVPMKNIDIALESYDDIFSDFDISTFAKRELSEDFIKELVKRTSIERDAKSFQFTLSIPASKRDHAIERIIHRRIKQHFIKRSEGLDADIKSYQHRGIKYIIAGSAIIILHIFLPNDIPLVEVFSNIILVAGWFGVWTGIAKILDDPISLIRQQKLFTHLATAHYQFVNEEDVIILRQAESTEAIIKETAAPQQAPTKPAQK